MTRISGHHPQPVRFEGPLSSAEREAINLNPFRAVRHGTHRDITAISKLIKRDERLARKLCQEAGQREADWFGPEGIGERGTALKALGR